MDNKLIYFSTGDGVNAITEAVVYPINKLRGMRPNSTTQIDIMFDPIENDDSTSNKFDYVRLTITSNKHSDVIEAIFLLLQSEDKMIRIADLDNEIKANQYITGVAISYAVTAVA